MRSANSASPRAYSYRNRLAAKRLSTGASSLCTQRYSAAYSAESVQQPGGDLVDRRPGLARARARRRSPPGTPWPGRAAAVSLEITTLETTKPALEARGGRGAPARGSCRRRSRRRSASRRPARTVRPATSTASRSWLKRSSTAVCCEPRAATASRLGTPARSASSARRAGRRRRSPSFTPPPAGPATSTGCRGCGRGPRRRCAASAPGRRRRPGAGRT